MWVSHKHDQALNRENARLAKRASHSMRQFLLPISAHVFQNLFLVFTIALL
ncbi:hypothetical protein FIV00_19900 [Labrenzia sp. THAF82]|nr:hypothetical protein FIV00_19900 [Labrenzia sp. THAF82]